MPDKNLPETYKGYSTEELLRFWKAYAAGKEPSKSVEKLRAMRGLLREYKIAPVFKNPGAVSFVQPKPKESFALLLAKGKHLQNLKKGHLAAINQEQEEEGGER